MSRNGMGKVAALMGDGLAGKIVLLQVGVDRHGHRVPVVRITQIDFVIYIEVIEEIR